MGVDLFSGLGATALALGDMYGPPICNPAVFCECCAFSRALLKERAEQGYFGPRSSSIRIADDVRSLTRHPGDGDVQILTAGYCCQGLSALGTREGLCSLFFEIPRLADEFNEAFAFLENAPGQCSNEHVQRPSSCRRCPIRRKIAYVGSSIASTATGAKSSRAVTTMRTSL